ncbi:MAG TPA: hypothetical protein PLF30_00115 [Candidatus Moranbacteria bacterium]|nr:hypothetical protein [Candidatus Moranbacteria bacterium]HQB59312.1 hypothetical protein [Candidatus Moranbacteria bacterium]
MSSRLQIEQRISSGSIEMLSIKSEEITRDFFRHFLPTANLF